MTEEKCETQQTNESVETTQFRRWPAFAVLGGLATAGASVVTKALEVRFGLHIASDELLGTGLAGGAISVIVGSACMRGPDIPPESD